MFKSSGWWILLVGIVSAIKGSLENISLTEEFFERRLFGFASDAALFNHGDKDGTISIL